MTMAPNPLGSALSGALFGAALTAAGVYTPSIIKASLQLQESRLAVVFLTATAGGT